MFIGLISLLIASSGFITETPPLIREHLTSTNELKGVFTQTKMMDGKKYVTTGEYHLRPGVDFTWKTQEPFETLFYATPTNYVYKNEDESVSRRLEDLPGIERFGAVMRGDFSGFFQAFDALYREEQGKFYLKAKPRLKELAELLERVEAEGTVSNWVLNIVFPTKTSFTLELKTVDKQL